MATTTTNTLSAVNNVGYFDTALRGLITLSLLAPVLSMPSALHSSWLTLLALSSIYPLVTLLCRWDPIYDLIHSHRAHKARIKAQQMRDYVQMFQALAASPTTGARHSLPTNQGNDKTRPSQAA